MIAATRLACVALLASVGTAQAAPSLRCGIVVPQEDFDKTDRHGDLSPVATRVCATMTRSAPDSFPDSRRGVSALRAGRIDVLVGVSPDPATETARGLAEGPVLLNDPQGFLVRRDRGIARLADLRDRMVCFISGTPMEEVLDAAVAARGLVVHPHPFEESGEMQAALVGGSCDAITADRSALEAMRAGFHGQAAEFVVLPETIGDDPYVYLTRANEKRLPGGTGKALFKPD